MWPTLKPSQREAIVGSIDPQSATTVKTTAWVDAAQFENLEAIIQVGAITATGTVDAKIQQATDNAGTGAKAINNPQGVPKAITTMTAAGNGSQQVRINMRQDELDVTNGFRFVQLSITPAVAAALIAGVIQGVDPRYGPADGYAAASQIQIV